MTAPRTRRPGRWRLGVGLAAAVVLLAACSNSTAAINRTPQSGSTTAAAVGGVQQVTLDVDQNDRFVPDTVTVHPGRVTVTLHHTGQGAPHDFQIPGQPADSVPLTNAGQTQSATFTAPAPGRYRFVCSIHIAQGMTGTLIVLPG